MKKKIKSGILVLGALGFVMTIGACSSSPSSGGDSPDAIPPAADAATDAIPQGSPEQAAAAAAPAPAAPAPDAPAAAPAPAPAPDTAAAAPAPAAATPVASGSGGSEDYTVQKGDTLMKIAFETYGDIYKWKDIFEANKDKIKSPNAIPTGTVLKVDKPATPTNLDKNGERYLIKEGDTLGKISDDVYGTKHKWKKIWENNKQLIRDPNRIFAGFYIYYTVGPDDKKGDTQPAPMAAGGPPPGADARSPASVGGTSANPPGAVPVDPAPAPATPAPSN